jgi:hypothetical protein
MIDEFVRRLARAEVVLIDGGTELSERLPATAPEAARRGRA